MLCRKSTDASAKGFTLIELLVVIAIIGILSTIVLASLSSSRARARDSRRHADMNTMKKALELYYAKNGAYPSCSDFTKPGTDPYWYTCVNAALQADGELRAMIDDPEAPDQHYRYDNFCASPSVTSVQSYRMWGTTDNPQSPPNGTPTWWTSTTVGIFGGICNAPK